MRPLISALLVVLLGCGEERAVTSTPVEEPPPRAPVPDEAAEPRPADATERGPARVVDLPDGRIELPTLPSGTAAFEEVVNLSPVGEHNLYPTVEHPDPAMNAHLATRLPALTRAFLEGAEREASDSPVSEVSGRCDVSLAHPRLLSVACSGWVPPGQLPFCDAIAVL